MILIVLAAGAGRRLGGRAKALMTGPEGLTYLEMIVARAQEVGVSSCAVVVGPPYGVAVATEARRLSLVPLLNEDAECGGMASSVEVGFQWALAASDAANRALLWPVDHPLVSAETLARLCAAPDAAVAVIPTFEGRGGHPVIVSRPLWHSLAACSSAEEGARTVLRAHSGATLRIEVQDPAVVRDIDTPEDVP